MSPAELSALDAQALSSQLRSLAGEERAIQAQFLQHLDELDRRRAFLELGHPSLWEFCLRALHLREGAAGRRIGAMRVLRRFPELAPALGEGRLCLTTLCVLGPALTEANVAELSARASFKTKAEVEAIVASVRPRPAPADGVRRLPSPAAALLPDGGPVALPLLAPAPTPVLEATPPAFEASAFLVVPPPAEPPRRAELRAVSDQQWSMRVTLDAETRRELETLTRLLAHKLPGGDLASVLKEAIRCAVEKHGRRRGAVAPRSARPLRPSAPGTIQAEVRRRVWARDEGRCTFTAADGTRCGGRWKLELDHVRPRALGGPDTVENLRLRCRAHNLLHAEEAFGREHMDRVRSAASGEAGA